MAVATLSNQFYRSVQSYAAGLLSLGIVAEVVYGNTRLYTASQSELAERKKAEATLQREEARYHALFTAAQRQAQELALLDRVRTALARDVSLEAMFRKVVVAISEILGYQLVTLYRVHDDRLILQHEVGYGQLPAEIPISTGVMARAARTGTPQFVPDVRQSADFVEGVPGTVSEIAVPLSAHGRVVAVLNVRAQSKICWGQPTWS